MLKKEETQAKDCKLLNIHGTEQHSAFMTYRKALRLCVYWQRKIFFLPQKKRDFFFFFEK